MSAGPTWWRPPRRAPRPGNQRKTEPTSAIRAKLFPARGVRSHEAVGPTRSNGFEERRRLEATGEFCFGEWQDATPAVFLCALL
jgi:hypothetical protein